VPVDRNAIAGIVTDALEPHPWAGAAWLGGSDAFGRADELSDVDIQAIVEDDRVGDALDAVEAALAAVTPITDRLVMPMPTWHGHAQRFYRLRDASEFAALDLVVMRRSSPDRYHNETARHGRPVVLFDRIGAVSPAEPDPAGLTAALAARVAGIRERLPFTQPLVTKELHRGDGLAALAAYQRHVLDPLVVLYRIRHSPARHDFGLRYTRDDLPPEVQRELAELAFVASLEDLAAKVPRAQRRLLELLGELP
jgi:hypothetical protein